MSRFSAPNAARLLLDLQLDNQIFLRRTIAHAANRGGIAIIEPRRDADITLVGRMAVADVKSDINREVELDELRKMRDSVQEAASSIETSVTSGLSKAEEELNRPLIDDTPSETTVANVPSPGTEEAPKLAESKS